jgi:hypothetical protein
MIDDKPNCCKKVMHLVLGLVSASDTYIHDPQESLYHVYRRTDTVQRSTHVEESSMQHFKGRFRSGVKANISLADPEIWFSHW